MRFIQWQNYAHYLLLAIGILIWYQIAEMIISKFAHEFLFYLLMVVSLTIGLFLIDIIIHFLFYVAPPPIRWRD